MILIHPKTDYSLFLEKRTAEARIVDHREEKLQKARDLLHQKGPIREFLQNSGVSSETVMLLIRDSFGELSYLRYEKNSPVILVFDETVTSILECSFVPAGLEGTESREPPAPEGYGDLFCRFAAALPDPDLPDRSLFSPEEPLYFIDKQEELRTLLHQQAMIFFDFLREIREDLKAAAFRQGEGDFLILGKSDGDLSLLNKAFAPVDSAPGNSADPVRVTEGENFLLYLARTEPGIVDGVEIQGSSLLDPSEKEAVRVLAYILLNLWRVPR